MKKIFLRLLLLVQFTASCQKNAVTAVQKTADVPRLEKQKGKERCLCQCCREKAEDQFQVEDLQEQLKQLQLKHRSLEDEYAALQKRLSQQQKVLKEKLTMSIQTVSAVCKRCAEHTDKLGNLEERLKKLVSHIASLKRENRDSKAKDQFQVKDLQEQLKQLQLKHRSLEDEYAVLQKPKLEGCPGAENCAKCAGRIASLTRYANVAAEKAQKEYKQLETKHETLRQLHEELRQAAQKIQDELNYKRSAEEDPKSVMKTSYEEKISLLEEELSATRDRLNYTQKKHLQVESESTSCKLEKQEIQDQLASLNKTLSGLSEVRAYLEKKAGTDERALEALRKVLDIEQQIA